MGSEHLSRFVNLSEPGTDGYPQDLPRFGTPVVASEPEAAVYPVKDGGTVALSFRAIEHPSSDEIGRLSELVQREITLSLYPPSPEDQLKQELAGMDEDEE